MSYFKIKNTAENAIDMFNRKMLSPSITTDSSTSLVDDELKAKIASDKSEINATLKERGIVTSQMGVTCISDTPMANAIRRLSGPEQANVGLPEYQKQVKMMADGGYSAAQIVSQSKAVDDAIRERTKIRSKWSGPGSQNGVGDRPSEADRPYLTEPYQDNPALLRIVSSFKAAASQKIVQKRTSKIFAPRKILKKRGSSIREKTLYQTDRFLLTGAPIERSENVQILDTFGSEGIAYFFGERPQVRSYTGVLLDTKNAPWKAEFLEVYYSALRGTRLVELGARAYISYQNMLVEGYIIECRVPQMAEQDKSVQFSITMLVTNETIMASEGLSEKFSSGSPSIMSSPNEDEQSIVKSWSNSIIQMPMGIQLKNNLTRVNLEPEEAQRNESIPDGQEQDVDDALKDSDITTYWRPTDKPSSSGSSDSGALNLASARNLIQVHPERMYDVSKNAKVIEKARELEEDRLGVKSKGVTGSAGRIQAAFKLVEPYFSREYMSSFYTANPTMHINDLVEDYVIKKQIAESGQDWSANRTGKKWPCPGGSTNPNDGINFSVKRQNYGENKIVLPGVTHIVLHHLGNQNKQGVGVKKQVLDWTERNSRSFVAAAHFLVTKEGIFQLIDLVDSCNHAGCFNSYTIGIEIDVPTAATEGAHRDSRLYTSYWDMDGPFSLTLDYAAQLSAALCYIFGISTKHKTDGSKALVDHSDVRNMYNKKVIPRSSCTPNIKWDPAWYTDKTGAQRAAFVSTVDEYYDALVSYQGDLVSNLADRATKETDQRGCVSDSLVDTSILKNTGSSFSSPPSPLQPNIELK